MKNKKGNAAKFRYLKQFVFPRFARCARRVAIASVMFRLFMPSIAVEHNQIDVPMNTPILHIGGFDDTTNYFNSMNLVALASDSTTYMVRQGDTYMIGKLLELIP